MKKIINEPTQVVDEMLQGLSFMHDDLVERLDGFDVIVRKAEKTGKVGLISGGGSGHEPSHAWICRRWNVVCCHLWSSLHFTYSGPNFRSH